MKIDAKDIQHFRVLWEDDTRIVIADKGSAMAWAKSDIIGDLVFVEDETTPEQVSDIEMLFDAPGVLSGQVNLNKGVTAAWFRSGDGTKYYLDIPEAE
jgi:hypothetical protein